MSSAPTFGNFSAASSIQLDATLPTPLVAQLATRLGTLIRNGDIPAGERIPSIRHMARLCRVSPLTVANAYTRLVEAGVLVAHARGGYFAACTAPPPRPDPGADDPLWLLQHAYETTAPTIKAGCGWLSEQYRYSLSVRRALERLARSDLLPTFLDYGNPAGFPALRLAIRQLLARRAIPCPEEGIVLTHGASQGLELALRACTKPGDTVLVDDPGYCNLYPLLHMLGLGARGVPRTKEGVDITALEHILAHERATVMVTTSVLHNPTGVCSTAANITALYALACQHGLTVIEDNIFLDLAPQTQPCLARMDTEERVVHVGSFSKTITPGLRVGYVRCAPDLARRIMEYKMAVGLTSSSLNEALVCSILQGGFYHSHLADLREGLFKAQKATCAALLKAGLALYTQPSGGMFVWARFPGDKQVRTIMRRAAQADILLAPGSLFCPTGQDTPWFRFNVTQCDSPTLLTFLRAEARSGF